MQCPSGSFSLWGLGRAGGRGGDGKDPQDGGRAVRELLTFDGWAGGGLLA